MTTPAHWIDRLAPTLVRLLVIGFLGFCAFVVVGLFYRATLHVGWMRTEGWTAFHAHDFWAGQPMYHPAASLIANNYPPLAYMAIAGLMHVLPDAVFAGRFLSAVAFLLIALLIALLVRRETGDTFAGCFGAGVFMACLFIRAGNFVATNDPQMLAHVPALLALLILLRAGLSPMATITAAALFAISLFIKHNIFALPLAVFLYLLRQDLRSAVLFAAVGLVLSLAGLAICYWGFGPDFIASMLAPRRYTFQAMRTNVESNLGSMVGVLIVAAVMIAVGPRSPLRNLGLIYASAAIVVGVIWSGGEGTGPNLFFDLHIAIGLISGCLVARPNFAGTPRPELFRAWAFVALIVGSLFGPGLWTAKDAAWLPGWITYYQQREADTQDLIRSIARQPGLVLCETPLFCYWAGKTFEVDLFFFTQDIALGRKTDAELRQRIADGGYSAVVLDSINHTGGVARLLPPGVLAAFQPPIRPRTIDPVVVPLR